MDKDLLYRFFEGHASVEEMKSIKEWAETSEENSKLLRRERKLFNAIILSGRLKRMERQTAKKKNYFIREFLKVASVVVITVGVTAALFSVGKDKDDVNVAMQTITVPAGQRVNLDLPDGSNVWLNAGTTMKYPVSFMKGKREVILNGEAYFEVRKNEKLPFDVMTKELNVKVLGTKFNFRNYDEDEEVTVNLLEGKVQLENYVKKMGINYLSPSEKVTLNKLTGEMIISRAEVKNAKEWMNGGLFFDEMPLSDIVKELNRSYNVKIHIVDEQLAHNRFYALFNRKEQSIYNVLDIITATNQVRYKVEGDSILLYAK